MLARSVLTLTLCCWAAAQAPRPLARYKWAGRDFVVTSDDVAMEMAPRHRRTQRGEETIQHLIDLHLVRSAASAKGVLPSDADVKAQLAEYYKKIKEQGQDPEKLLQRQGVTEAELTDYTMLTLALDRLVTAELGLADQKNVTNEYRELWLKDAKKKAAVVTDESKLEAGIVARCADKSFTLLDLGRTLAARSGSKERQRFARQVVLRQILELEAKDKNITVSRDECEAAVARIRARAEQEKAGVSFSNVLEALGTSPTELIDSPVLRAQVIARALLAREHSEDKVQERLAKDGAEVQARWGARRRLDVLWLRATDTPNPLVKRSFADARAEASKLREKIVGGEPFATVARRSSDDPRSKLRGGDTGWHHRRSKLLPEPVLAWAFDAAPEALSEPIQVEDGICLVQVGAAEPTPTLATLRARMLEDLEEELYRDLLTKAEVTYEEGA